MISSESLVCMDLAHATFVRKTHFYLLNLTTRISIFCILYRNCTQTSDEGEGSALISHFWFFSLFQNWGDKSIRSAEYCIFATFLWDSSLYNFIREKTQDVQCPGVLWSDVSAIAGLGAWNNGKSGDKLDLTSSTTPGLQIHKFDNTSPCPEHSQQLRNFETLKSLSGAARAQQDGNLGRSSS